MDRVEGMRKHREYYSQFVTENTINYVIKFIGEKRLRDSKDQHLNDIPLQEWDSLAIFCKPTHSVKLKEAGAFWSLSAGVCILKEASRQFLEK